MDNMRAYANRPAMAGAPAPGMQVKSAAAPRELVIGTSNPGKRRELADLLRRLGIRPIIPNGPVPEVEETANSYKGNASLKAETLARYYGKPVISEDSGLGVRALKGAPGLRSGRYAGMFDHNSQENVRKLLQVLRGVKDRNAGFVTAAAVSDGKETVTATRRQSGKIAEEPRGDKGFSYDTVFIPEGSYRTYAETGDKRDSARDRAVIALIEKLRNGEE